MSQKNNTAAVIANGCLVKGDLKLSGPLYINGSIEGNVHSSSSVVVGASGNITGDIHSASLVLNGTCAGTVRTSSLEVLDRGAIAGAAYCNTCSISEGGKLDGRVFLGKTQEAAGSQ